MNGWFTINDREGKFMFSSNIKDQLIILEYISDGLAYNLDSKFPMMAEQAIYMHIAHAIVSTTAIMPEYVVNRYKKELDELGKQVEIIDNDTKSLIKRLWQKQLEIQ